MKYKSNIVSSGSGSVSGCTFSHNRYGQYIRNRSIPVNPSSANQQIIRNAFSALATRWSTILDAVQRAGWNNYAAAVPKTDAFGDQIFILGFNWYIACNVNRYAAFGPSDVIDDAPTAYSLASFNSSAPDAPSVAGANIDINFDENDPWVSQDGGALFISFSKPLNATRNFFKGPFVSLFDITRIEGDATTPPTTPVTLSVPTFPYGVGSSIFVRMIAAEQDGRISSPAIYKTIAAA